MGGDDDDTTKGFVRIGLVAAPLLALALWGVSSGVGGTRLGSPPPDTGLFGPCLFIGVLVAAGFGFFSMRALGTTSIAIAAVAAVVAIVPAALAAFGFARWYNGMSIEDREETVDCEVIGNSRAGKHSGSGKPVSHYVCEVEGEKYADSTFSLTDTPFQKGERVRITVAKGRLGIWMRRDEPVLSPPR